MEEIRLDKFLSQSLNLTRSEVKKELKKGAVTVDGEVQTRPERKVNPDREQICRQGVRIKPRSETVWLMFHKPSGCVTATEDRRAKTVMDYITHPRRRELFPVGRLDRDTEGLLLLTNDGATAHRMLSPGRHVEKTYYVRVQGTLTAKSVEAFAAGMDIGDEKKTLPSDLKILTESAAENTISGSEGIQGKEAGESVPEDRDTASGPGKNEESPAQSEAEVTLTEGRFHQVKRMFAALGCPVLYLKRIRMASLSLDESLSPGEFRELTEEERERIHALCWNRQKQ